MGLSGIIAVAKACKLIVVMPYGVSIERLKMPLLADKVEFKSTPPKIAGPASTSWVGSGTADRPPVERLVQSEAGWHKASASPW
jgi:hypothetical protein